MFRKNQTKLNLVVLLMAVAVMAMAGAVQANEPPIADAGEDVSMFIGKTVVLHGTATDPDGDTIVAWLWTIESKPEGSWPFLSDDTGQSPFFMPDMAGDYVLSLVAYDGTDWSLPDSITVHAALNLPPTAIAMADVTTGPAPLTVNFDASQSYDPEGGPLVFAWSFGDGTRSSEVTPTHVFQWAGTFLVGLQVWDDWAQLGWDTVLIEVLPAENNISVSPSEYDFGDVVLGVSEAAIVTISNVGGADLTVTNIGLGAGSNSEISIISSPPLPAVIAPAGFVDVDLAFAPSALDYFEATLQIESDDADEPLVQVLLGGLGVVSEEPPEGQIAAILSFINASVTAGTLTGDGSENAADNHLNVLINMLEASGDLIEDGEIEMACRQLAVVLKKCDGMPSPPDFVTGEATPVLKAMIEVLMTTLDCE